MEELLSTIDTFLSRQPWWVIALGTAFLCLMLRRRSHVPKENRGKFESFDGNASSSIRVVSKNVSIGMNPTSSVQKNEFQLEGEDAAQLQALLGKGDKIGAIKLIREKTGVDLVDAKKIVEAL